MSSNISLCLKLFNEYNTQGDLVNPCQVCKENDIFDYDINKCYINIITHQIICSDKKCAIKLDNDESHWILFDMNYHTNHFNTYMIPYANQLHKNSKTYCKICNNLMNSKCRINLITNDIVCSNKNCALKLDKDEFHWTIYDVQSYIKYVILRL